MREDLAGNRDLMVQQLMSSEGPSKKCFEVLSKSEDWQLRLVNGQSICEGRVEVYYDGVWGRVTDTQWNFNEAEVVCRQLKCGSAISIFNHMKFGKGRGPTWISNVRCNGSEPFLWNCSFTKTEQSSIGDDVGVVCSDHIQIRLVDGGSRCAGRVELYSNGTWGTVCDDSWDLTDAQVVCNQLKCGQALNATISEHRAVRLQDGPTLCQGRLEVFYNGIWGTVCADSFGMEEAEVVCKQLSCGSAQSVEPPVTFGSGSGQIWLDDVNCRSHDTLLWQCPSSPWGKHNCNHQEDVGVVCSELRLTAGFDSCSGRVEIFFSGTWGTVCDDSWDKQDAAVICQQLNCGGPIWTVGGMLFDQGQQKLIAPFNQARPPTFIIPSILVILLIAVSLALAAELQRSFQKANKNRNFDPVYEEIKAQDIGAGPELRNPTLVGPHAPCGGILKVYDRGQWKSVCSNSWDSAAGEVVCKQIGCEFYLSGQVHPVPHGPVVLDKIQCKGTESSLSECALTPSGQQKCDTETGVIVICNGIYELLINVEYFCEHTLSYGISQEYERKSLKITLPRMLLW
ncbi:scavenger receptor cysteine-rich type 1 protein M130-like [Chiloscyllium punctatum]|uniref:scavenger receptor cysteine-rich type 1 protein M130-like n=1 Tax=Chiloscyllium punctatum TaxID=137246 RepID=UPI003B633D3E